MPWKKFDWRGNLKKRTKTWLVRTGKIYVLWTGGTKRLGKSLGPGFVAWLPVPRLISRGAGRWWRKFVVGRVSLRLGRAVRCRNWESFRFLETRMRRLFVKATGMGHGKIQEGCFTHGVKLSLWFGPQPVAQSNRNFRIHASAAWPVLAGDCQSKWSCLFWNHFS